MAGRAPIPASQFVLKVHSRCDLACDHCYVYQGADRSWRGRPMMASREVVSQAAWRIAEHVKSHQLDAVEVVLHGGEPLLAGEAGLRRILAELDGALRGVCRLDLRMHTNGVLLTEGLCELFAEYGVRVGISLDGGREANDRHRRYRDGRSSYDQAVRGVRLLASDRFRHLYAGLLCTIDIASEPIAVYESLLGLHPPRIDFLLPHATWDAPPPRPAGQGAGYAGWLTAIFDRWQGDGCPVRIRTFDSIVATLAGGESSTEALGLGPARTVVIETDGAYEQPDSLKVAYDGAPATGLDVFGHALDAVLAHPAVAARQRGAAGLCAECQRCPVLTSCGGGLYAHRYRTGSGFANPSVYCTDLLELIGHVQDRLPPAAARRPGASHAISEEALAGLASGLGGADAVGQLTQAQRSLRRALLAAVYAEGVSARAASAADRDRLRAAWQVIMAADRDSPAAVDAVLAHPYLRVWAVRCLERLRRASGPAGPDAAVGDRTGGGRTGGGRTTLAADLGHLGAIAAAVAIRARASARLSVPVLAGAVHLPGLGRLAAGPAAGASAVVEVDQDWVRVRLGAGCWRLPRPAMLAGADRAAEPCPPGAGGGGPQWQPVRMLTAAGIRVALEDTDPYRDCHQWPAADRLTSAEFAAWQRGFGLAWREIQASHRAYEPAIAAGLTVLMPMSAPEAGHDVSSAARQAYGAIGMALPDDPVTLALLLIHEFQHVKLGAILDLFDLFDPADKRLYHAPWRADPRPLEGLLQGTYAHLAVTEFWRARAGRGDGDRARAGRRDPSEEAAAEGARGGAGEAAGAGLRTASQRYRHWRAHTADAIGTLAGTGSLTPLGARFVDQMRNAISAGR